MNLRVILGADLHKSRVSRCIAIAIGAVIFFGPTVAGAQTQPAQTKPSSPSTTAKKSPDTSAPRPAYDRALLHPALLKEKAPDLYKVKFSTTRGDFVVTVTRSWAPLGADRFYNLIKHHFYDNASFFRVLPGFVAQFGISAYPAVNAVWEHADIKDDPSTHSNLRGYLTFATGGPNTRTTQVFVNLFYNTRLDSMGFSAFGQVTEGMNVVEMLYDVYGEGAPSGGGPDQDEIQKKGKAYLDKGWPKLDLIKAATIIFPEPSATPATGTKPATKPASGTTAKTPATAPAAKSPQ
jgi:peptidyl-prolyl cis-trans isomerase A (cyclophilin A)